MDQQSDGDPSKITITASSNNTDLLPDSVITITGTGADRTLSIAPAAGKAGEATITLQFADDEGETSTRTFKVTVQGSTPSDQVAPTIEVFSPDDDAINVAVSDNLVLTFSETVKAGMGTIAIYLDDGNVDDSMTPVEAIDVTSDKVAINGKMTRPKAERATTSLSVD